MRVVEPFLFRNSAEFAAKFVPVSTTDLSTGVHKTRSRLAD